MFRTVTDKNEAPEGIIDITGIPGLNSIDYDKNKGLRIGALCTHDEIENSQLVRDKYALLAQAVQTVGSVQIRCLGTIGGNLCNASPSADSAPALIGLGSKVKIFGPSGERTLPLDDFFKGPGQTALKADEILTEIVVPNLPPRSGGVYLKLGRRKAFDLAIVSVAAVVSLASGGKTCSEIRIVLGGVAPTPLRAKQAEDFFRGKVINQANIEEAGKIAAGETRPISDVRSSAEYRKTVAEVLTRRAIQQALLQAQNTI